MRVVVALVKPFQRLQPCILVLKLYVGIVGTPSNGVDTAGVAVAWRALAPVHHGPCSDVFIGQFSKSNLHGSGLGVLRYSISRWGWAGD